MRIHSPLPFKKTDKKHKPVLYLGEFFLIGGSMNPLFGRKKDLGVH